LNVNSFSVLFLILLNVCDTLLTSLIDCTYISIRGCVTFLGVAERLYMPLTHSHFGIFVDFLFQLDTEKCPNFNFICQNVQVYKTQSKIEYQVSSQSFQTPTARSLQDAISINPAVQTIIFYHFLSRKLFKIPPQLPHVAAKYQTGDY